MANQTRRISAPAKQIRSLPLPPIPILEPNPAAINIAALVALSMWCLVP
jgi:hypothetical protein